MNAKWRYIVLFLFVKSCLFFSSVAQQPKKGTNDCPDFKKAKDKREGKKPKEGEVDGVKILRGTNIIKFNVIKLSDKKLEIPAFKQFKNNMTDFTANGEAEFKLVVQKIRDYLGDNTKGEGVVLDIIGSASQIPTSFDPTLPNNNINPDGSSIPGKTTIENNKQLALARATELGKKIKAVFPDIELNIPKIGDIKLGETPWDVNAQKKLNAATIKKDQKAIDAVHAPYQKEQYVMVRTREYKTEEIQPEALRTFYINVSPPIFHMDVGGSFNQARFVVSEAIYNQVGGTLVFNTVEERDEYLKNELKVTLYHPFYLKQDHWMMLTAKEASHLKKTDDYKKVRGLYNEKVFDMKDRTVLEEIIVTELLKTIK